VAHPHAATMMQYALDAAESDTPWTRWEMRLSPKAAWLGLSGHPYFQGSVEYRRTHNTHLAPIKVQPQDGEQVWAASPYHYTFTMMLAFDKNVSNHMLLLERGLLHKDRHAAVLHAKALCGQSTLS